MTTMTQFEHGDRVVATNCRAIIPGAVEVKQEDVTALTHEEQHELAARPDRTGLRHDRHGRVIALTRHRAKAYKPPPKAD